MYRKDVRRRRIVLVALVVACLVLLSLSFSQAQSGPVASIQRALATVAAPIEEGASRVLKPARDLVNWVGDTFSAQGENDDLEAELASTRAELARAEGAIEENEDLRAQLDLPTDGEISAYEPVTARVIGRSSTAWYSTVQIDKGTSAGLQVNDAVRTGDGLVGKIGKVTSGTATVSLITDHRNAVTAEVVPDGTQGLVEAEVGDPEELRLDFIENEEPVDEASILITAGIRDGQFSSYYPPGIEIGRVTESTTGQGESQEVVVEPFADIRNLQYVEVLTGGPDTSGVPE